MRLDPILALAAYGDALIAFVGVVVGGIISGGSQLFFMRRREVGERCSAARLVDADLGRARAVIQHCLGPPTRFAHERASELELAAWEHGRGVLAVGLPLKAWTAVQDGVGVVDAFRRGLEDSEREVVLNRLAEDASAGIDAARRELEPHLKS